MMKTDRCYLQHGKSGETYAVMYESEDQDKIIRIAGPLYYKERTLRNLEEWNFDDNPDDVEWAEKQEWGQAGGPDENLD